MVNETAIIACIWNGLFLVPSLRRFPNIFRKVTTVEETIRKVLQGLGCSPNVDDNVLLGTLLMQLKLVKGETINNIIKPFFSFGARTQTYLGVYLCKHAGDSYRQPP